MAQYKTIFLDLDNTLFSFDDMYRKASLKAVKDIIGLEKLGVDLDVFYQHFRKTADSLYFDYEAGRRTMGEYQKLRWIHTFRDFHLDISAKQIQDLTEHIEAGYLQFVTPFPGAEQFLIQLNRDHRVGLITNGSVDMQTAKLEKMNFTGYFDPDLCIISEEAGVCKPDPEIFHIALKKAGVPPEDALHIGDSIKHDIAGANQVGMDSAWIHYRGREGAVTPTYCFDSFAEAAEALLT